MTSQGLHLSEFAVFRYNVMGAGANLLPNAMLLFAHTFAVLKLN